MLILCCQGDTACGAMLTQNHTYPSHCLTLIQIKQETTVRLKYSLLSALAPLKINFLSVLSSLCPSHRLPPNQVYSLLKAVWLKDHWCWTLSPDTFNLKQSTLGWLTRPSADRRQNKTHCFLFQDCCISQAALCLRAYVHQALHHCLAAS